MSLADLDDIEQVLHVAPQVLVYRVPPLKSNEGYRANDWGDLETPLWKGRLRIIETGAGVSIRLEDSSSGELFAQAHYDPKKPCVDSVLDSSRYFVIRVEDAGKKAFIGIGFVERSSSFDFNVALQDYTKRWKKAQEPPSESSGSSPHLPAGPKKDYSLKDGQTFSISIPGKSASGTKAPLLGQKTSGGAVPLLPPPPGSKR